MLITLSFFNKKAISKLRVKSPKTVNFSRVPAPSNHAF